MQQQTATKLCANNLRRRAVPTCGNIPGTREFGLAGTVEAWAGPRDWIGALGDESPDRGLRGCRGVDDGDAASPRASADLSPGPANQDALRYAREAAPPPGGPRWLRPGAGRRGRICRPLGVLRRDRRSHDECGRGQRGLGGGRRPPRAAQRDHHRPHRGGGIRGGPEFGHGRPAGRGHTRRPGLLAGGLRRRHLHLRRRRLLRLDGRDPPQPAHRGHGGHTRRPGLLAGGLRRRHLQLRRRRLLRLHRQPAPQPTHRGHGGHPRRPGLLAGGLRRRHLQLRRRRLLRLHRQPAPQPTHRRHGGHPRRPGLLAGGLRRRHLHLRRRRLLRLHRQPAPQPTHRRHGGHPRRQGLLVGGLRRRHLHLRRCPLLRFGAGFQRSRQRRGAGVRIERAGLLGRRRRRGHRSFRRGTLRGIDVRASAEPSHRRFCGGAAGHSGRGVAGATLRHHHFPGERGGRRVLRSQPRRVRGHGALLVDEHRWRASSRVDPGARRHHLRHSECAGAVDVHHPGRRQRRRRWRARRA